MHQLNVTPVVGLPSFEGWSQVTSDPTHKTVWSFSLAGANASNVGRDIVDLIADQACNSGADFHHLCQKISQDAQNKDCQLSLAAGWFVQGRCYLATLSGKIWLRRHQKVGTLLKSDHLQLIEGTYQSDDIFVLATDQAASFSGELEQKLQQGFDVDTIITSLVPGIHALADSATTAFGFINFAHNSIESSGHIPLEVDSGLAPSELSDPENQPPSSARTITSPSRAMPIKTTLTNSVLMGGKKTAREVTRVIAQLVNRWSRHDVYLKPSSSRKTARLLLAVTLVIGLAGGLIWFRQSRLNQLRQTINNQLVPLQSSLTQAELSATDQPVQARDQVKQVLSQLAQLASAYQDQPLASRLILDQQQQAQDLFDQISGQHELAQLPVFYDLRLIEQDYLSNAIQFQSGKLYFLDREKKLLLELDTQTKQATTIDLRETSDGLVDMSVRNNTIVLLGNNITQLALRDNNTTKQLRSSEPQLEGATLVDTFGEAVYILNPERQEVLKYTTNENQTLDSPTSWLRAVQGLDVSQVKALNIDGDIWLTTKDGQVFRLRSGNNEPFAIQGLSQPFTSALQIVTTQDLEQLYILEPAQNRIVVVEKDTGIVLKEISSISLATTTDLTVTDDGSTIYAVSGAEVFEIKVNQN